MKLLRIIPDNTHFSFMRFRRISFPISALFSVLSVLLFLTIGMNFGIDFKGGTDIELQARSGTADLGQLRSLAQQLNLGDVEIQSYGDKGEVMLRFGLQPGGDAAQQATVAAVHNAVIDRYDWRGSESVGPRITGELVQRGTLGIVLSVVTVLIYLWFRFEWQFALGAVIATLHDLVLTIGFFALSGLEFNSSSIAAILTIVGYSLNDTVVVFDRIREMMRKYKKMSIVELLDISINTTLSRTLMTSFTIFLALLALVALGGRVLQSFSIAMLFGVVVGTYSSIFIAAPILIYLGVRVEGAVTANVAANVAAKPAARSKSNAKSAI